MIVYDDAGLPTEREMGSTINNAFYNQIREIFRNLTHLNADCLFEVIRQKFIQINNGSQYSFDNINAVCWTFGCMSGISDKSVENVYFI